MKKKTFSFGVLKILVAYLFSLGLIAGVHGLNWAVQSASQAPAVGILTPGTYTASDYGFGGEVTVTLTVGPNGGIDDAALEGPNETPAIGGEALPVLLDAPAVAADIAAVAAVSAMAVQDARKKAESAVCVAKRTVGKDLQLDVRNRRHGRYLLLRKLTGRNHTVEAKLTALQHARHIVNGHLSRRVKGHPGKVGLHQMRSRQILDNQRVHPQVTKPYQNGNQPRSLILPKQCVQRHIDLSRVFPVVMGQPHQDFQVFEGEVLRVGAC